jgi:sarcosine oxidase subunit alpha
MTERVDVAIVGAGAAGLAAAGALAERDLVVRIFDEYPEAGGRLLGQRYRLGRRRWDGREVASELLRSLHGRPHVFVATGVTVYEVAGDATGGFLVRTHPDHDVTARRVLVATGAGENPVPLPGWTLPGVMTVGGAQVMAVVHRVLPGRRGLIIGTGVLSFAIAAELHEAGVEWLGLVMAPESDATAHLGSVTERWDALSHLGSVAPPLLRPLVRLLRRPAFRPLLINHYPRAGVALAGTHVHLHQVATRVVGDQEVAAVELRHLDGRGQPIGPARLVPVDFVLLSGGLSPVTELLDPLGVRMTESPALGGRVPVLSSTGETSHRGLYVAGNAGGIESGAVAVAQGRLVGLHIAHSLGGSRPELASALAAAQRSLSEVRREAPFEFNPGARKEVVRVSQDLRA